MIEYYFKSSIYSLGICNHEKTIELNGKNGENCSQIREAAHI